jgi:hypothetical protein
MLGPFKYLAEAIAPETGGMPVDLAKQVLSWTFPPHLHARYEELSAKASRGALTTEEDGELTDLLGANDLLTILKSKARVSLRQHSPAA